MAAKQPSKWQQSITGEWHGMPSVFDAEGRHVGFDKVARESRFEDGRTTYYMTTQFDTTGPLRGRFESETFAFGVQDSDRDRLYLGPDFIGAGHPYGALVDSHYYSPAWTSDLRTMNQILPDGETQVYSSLLFDGPAVCGVFNGIYKVVQDYAENPETRARIAEFLEGERRDGKKPHILPVKHAGEWRGELEVYDPDQQLLGVSEVRMRYRPLSLLRAEMEVTLSGIIEREFRFERQRNGFRHNFDGPDLYGNGMSYGRALFTSQHLHGEALKIRGREFLIDSNYTLCVAWQWFASDKPRWTSFGLLHWQPGEEVLKPRHGS